MRAETTHDRLNTKNQPTKKPLEIIDRDGSQGLVIGQIVTPMGLEQSPNSRGNKQSGGDVPMYVPISGAITPDLIELIGLWDSMSEAARIELLESARSLV